MEAGVNPDLDYLLDPQQARPCGLCENCGKEIYTRGRCFCEECEDK